MGTLGLRWQDHRCIQNRELRQQGHRVARHSAGKEGEGKLQESWVCGVTANEEGRKARSEV